MPRGPPAAMVVLAAVGIFLLYVLWTSKQEQPMSTLSHVDKFIHETTKLPVVSSDTLHGDAIMGKLGNETLKAELGRAAWKLFHTTMARFPDKPSADESDALKSYIHLFARLYPCGECAEHFQKILKKYPPQTATRSSAAAWACFVHNEVNISKGKDIFDCNNIGDFYDCGCAEDEKEAMSTAGANYKSATDSDAVEQEPVEIEREGPTRGG